MKPHEIYWFKKTIDGHHYLFASTHNGLCYVDRLNDSFSLFEQWCHKHFLSHVLIEDDQFLTQYINELEQYFSNKLTFFNSSLQLIGTPFQQLVWKALQTIPYGEVVTYSYIANKINKPTAVRAVANAIGANPILIFIPCHRVIGKDGTLTGFRAGLNLKKQLLKLENSLHD